MNRQESDKDRRSNRISLQGGSSPATSVMSNNPLPAIRPSNARLRSGADARVGSDRCNRIAASFFAKQILVRKSANTHLNDFTAIKQKSVSRGKGGRGQITPYPCLPFVALLHRGVYSQAHSAPQSPIERV